MKVYDTVTAAINDLRQSGYTLDFNLAFDQLQCSANGLCLTPSGFEIAAVYRFEGDTDPADEAVVYAISDATGTHKGILVSAYGTYADTLSTEMLQKLSIHIQ